MFRIEFPPCVQWFTIEFDNQCGTAQPEDYLLVSIPKNFTFTPGIPCESMVDNQSQYFDDLDDNSLGYENYGLCKNACLTVSETSLKDVKNNNGDNDDEEWHVAQMFNT